MVEGLQALVEISRVDLQIAELEEARTSLPKAREQLQEERRAGLAAVEEAEGQLREAEQEQRRHESMVADREALVAKLEGQSAAVKSNEAYTALLHEIEHGKTAISEAETAVLEAMDTIESATATLERAREASARIESEADGRIAALDEREKNLESTLARLRHEREGHAEGVGAAELAKYEKIASRRKPALAVASGGNCMGCRVGLPPQTMIELQRSEAMLTCGNCHRILVLETPS